MCRAPSISLFFLLLSFPFGHKPTSKPAFVPTKCITHVSFTKQCKSSGSDLVLCDGVVLTVACTSVGDPKADAHKINRRALDSIPVRTDASKTTTP